MNQHIPYNNNSIINYTKTVFLIFGGLNILIYLLICWIFNSFSMFNSNMFENLPCVV